MASRSLRIGPDSLLIRWVRELEPYLREVLQPEIYAVEGTYRALLRYGLLHDYPHLYSLPAGLQGGIVALADRVIAGHGDAAAAGIDRVIYLIDPSDPTSLFPDSLALKRECVVTGKVFLATYTAASEWYTLQWYASAIQAGDSPEPTLARYFLPQTLLEGLLPEAGQGIGNQAIGLIAHDTKKKEMLQFAQAHFHFLKAFQSRLATGTTGALLNGQLPQRLVTVWEGLEAETQAFEKVGHLPRRLGQALEDRRQLEALARQLAEGLNGESWVSAFPSGPQGGDVRIADVVREGRCQKVLFFEDPHVSREHEADIQLLERTTRILGREAVCLHDMVSATEWARHWEACIAGGMANPTTLFQAFRRLWGVELVLADLGKEKPADQVEEEAIWRDIVDKAAWYAFGLIAERALARRRTGDTARVAVTWGYGMHELIEALRQVKTQLAGLNRDYPNLSRPVVGARFRTPGNVLALPMIGIIGATNPRNEANHNAALLGELFGGKTVSLPHVAFCEERYQKEIQDSIQAMVLHWDDLDVALLTCDEVKRHFTTALLPEMLHSQMARTAAAEIGGLYLKRTGAETIPKHYRRVGMSQPQLRAIAAKGGAILIAGAQQQRLEPALAALQGGVVSVLVTNLDFAWGVLKRHTAQKDRRAG